MKREPSNLNIAEYAFYLLRSTEQSAFFYAATIERSARRVAEVMLEEQHAKIKERQERIYNKVERKRKKQKR